MKIYCVAPKISQVFTLHARCVIIQGLGQVYNVRIHYQIKNIKVVLVSQLYNDLITSQVERFFSCFLDLFEMYVSKSSMHSHISLEIVYHNMGILIGGTYIHKTKNEPWLKKSSNQLTCLSVRRAQSITRETHIKVFNHF